MFAAQRFATGRRWHCVFDDIGMAATSGGLGMGLGGWMSEPGPVSLSDMLGGIFSAWLADLQAVHGQLHVGVWAGRGG
jgi:hypothetical protein